MAIANEQLATARIRKRWSVSVASERVGVSINTFNRWERGLQVPQLSTLDLVCKAFDMSPEDLGFGHAIIAKRRTRSQSAQVQAEPIRAPSSPPPAVPTVAKATEHTVITPTADVLCTTSGNICTPIPQFDEWKDGSEDEMASQEISRRRIITTLIGTPITILGLPHSEFSKLLHPEEILSLCQVSIPFSWRLYFEGGLDEVNRTLPGYLSQLTKLAQEPSRYQQRAASLASQGYQLASLLSSQYQNFGTAATYAIQALTFAHQVDDPHLQATSFIRQALIYFYLKRPQQRLQAYERALHYSQKASPLLQGRAHIGLSETYSNLGNEQEAHRHLELAYTTFPDHYEDDPAYPFTHFDHSSLSSLEGIMYLNLNHPQRAWESFSQIDKELSRSLIPNRLELTIRQAMTSFKLGERDQSCSFLQIAVRSALKTGNQLRYDEAYDIYEHMVQKWGNESCVKETGSLFLNT